MSHSARSGFTRVELAVVLVVLGLMLALLLPALQSSRSGRRAPCLNNLRNIGLALLSWETAHQHFPGYRNRLDSDRDGRPVVTGWVAPILPQLERNDLWEIYRDPNVPADEKPDPRLSILICPNDPTTEDAPLSYVVNCGLPGDSDTVGDGVFFNHDVASEPIQQSLDFISKHDGAQNTLMLSENLQAGLWTDTTEADVGMVWLKSPGPYSHISQGSDVGDRPQDIRYARPSSGHGGGANVVFCSGAARFLDEDIDYRVYQHLMTPDSAAAGIPGELYEGDF